MGKCEHGLTSKKCYTCASPKYGKSAPPQREPLSEEEILNIIADGLQFGTFFDVARAIERAHGIGGQDD